MAEREGERIMNTAPASALLPCPFCGKAARLHHNGIGCMDSDCAGFIVTATPEEWNRRAHLAAGSGEGWVSVKDGLPEDGQTVIVWGTDHLERAGWAVIWRDLGDDHINDAWLKRWEVTHWQPLPPAPQEKSDERYG